MRSPEQRRRIPFKQLTSTIAAAGLLITSTGCKEEASFLAVIFPDCQTDSRTQTQSKTLDFNRNPKTIDVDGVIFSISQPNPVQLTIFPEGRIQRKGNHRIFDGRTDGRTYDVELGKPKQTDSSAQVPLKITAACKINQQV